MSEIILYIIACVYYDVCNEYFREGNLNNNVIIAVVIITTHVIRSFR